MNALRANSLIPVLGLAVILALLVAGLAIPSRSDLGLYQFRDGDYGAAHDRYAALYHDGDRSVRTIVMLAEIALAEGRRADAAAVLEKERGQGESHPRLRALWASLQAGSWCCTAEGAGDGAAAADPATLRARLAVYDAAGDVGRVRDVLQALQRSGAARADELAQLGALLAAGGDTGAAAPVLIEALRRDPASASHPLWKTALLLLREQRAHADAVALAQLWVGQQPDAAQRLGIGYWLIDIGWLELAEALYDNDQAAGQALLAYADVRNGDKVAARRRLAALRAQGSLPADFEQLYAQLVVETGTRQELMALLPVLRERLPSTDRAGRLLYVHALSKANETDTLARYWLQIEYDPVIDSIERDAVMRALIEAKRYREIASALRQAAQQRDASWFAAYRDAALALGRRDELADVALRRSNDEQRQREDRHGAALVLLELGRKADAAQVLQTLGATSGPDDAVMNDLLFVWGPRPPQAALDWLVERAAAVSGRQRAAWLEVLVDAGGAASALEQLSSLSAAEQNETRVVQLRALAALQRWSEFDAALSALLASDGDLAALRQAAQLAERSTDPHASTRAWQAVLDEAPADLDALRGLALSVYRSRSWREARTRLGEYLEARPQDWEATFALAETLAALKQEALANTYYQATAALLAAQPEGDARRDLLQAMVAGRLGQFETARRRFDELLKARGREAQIVAEYASLLMTRGMYGEAEQILRR